MVDVHVADDQCLNMRYGKIYVQLVGGGALARGFGTLEQTAVHQQTGAASEPPLVAGPGYTTDGAVVGDLQQSSQETSSGSVGN